MQSSIGRQELMQPAAANCWSGAVYCTEAARPLSRQAIVNTSPGTLAA
jgi:hypothetical protein